MIERIRALVAEWRETGARSLSVAMDEDGDDEVREAELQTEGEVLRECADQLDAILADSGGWRPIAEMPADGLPWLFALGDDRGFVRARRSTWVDRAIYEIVLFSMHGGWSLTQYTGDIGAAMVAPLHVPEPPPQEPPR